MGSFRERYNDPNKRRLYSTKARNTFRSSFWAKVGERKREREQKRGMKGEVEGKRGNASPQTPMKRPMIFLCFLFSSFLSFTQYSSLDRKRSLPRQRVSTYPPLQFLVESFLAHVFSRLVLLNSLL